MSDESAVNPARHEPTDVSTRVIRLGMPILVASVIGLSLLVLWLFPGSIVDRTIHLPLSRYPAPELQVSPREHMAKFYASEIQWLNSTGWIDRKNGVVHIPIGEAMRKVAQEGISDWPAPRTEQLQSEQPRPEARP
jgi:hypothetical protein